MNPEVLEYHKNILQSANINFLIGSGLSHPYLSTLGNIEKNLTEVEQRIDIEETEKNIQAILYCKYFNDVMFPNKYLLCNETCESEDNKKKTLENYKAFLKIINSIIQKRGTTIINKQCNLFTTNIDLFIEKSIEELGLEFNDGFTGRISPVFNLSNYNKIISKRSHHFDNESKLPIFNILKVHGSLNWKYMNQEIYCSFDENKFDVIKKILR